MMQDLAVSASTSALSPIALFLQADIVVKAVMIGLLLASVWTWTIIVSGSMALTRAFRASKGFETDFWKSEDIDKFYEGPGRQDIPAAKVFSAGVAEWRRSVRNGQPVDRDGTRARLSNAMAAAAGAEIDRLSDRLNILATVGSVAPFVGLFGTVWGIMRSFTDIAASQNTSLGVVAPGIAEALFATALGLFAAIPAVIAYNRLLHRVSKIEGQLHRFGDAIHMTLSRELERA
ncbi:protein TolQ [Rhizorhabdus wittichii]|jgi:biopolymer transport protein TolQ|uniref:Tol-Pal system, TolQ n=2 Tax=Rhizorhabdus wittichii TaxID=160791 RepID=A0A9J9LE03_RHIWR|nr:protein TolQ [Rhizorhabdus wittichii]ABQ68495.1 Tol-Pal system, TolQ [Rhizorhabdus wittichii RW1]ARR54617.1 Tol-Pal system subunit TolQ [Rhizorhabdus wittichii DC-6]QTH21041.1 protein TolQ [Rhizorhabdus wittichii]